MRSLSPQKLQPADILKVMNQIIGERRIEGRFMTAVFRNLAKRQTKTTCCQRWAIAAVALQRWPLRKNRIDRLPTGNF